MPITEHCALIATSCCKLLFVDPRPKILKVLNFGVLTVWYLRQENGIETLRIEILFISGVLEIVHSWARILLAWKVVFTHLVWLEQLSLYLT